MTAEEPQVRMDIEFGADEALAVAPPSLMWVMRSNMSIGGAGKRALPSPNTRRAHRPAAAHDRGRKDASLRALDD
jgi:hypothetical protein